MSVALDTYGVDEFTPLAIKELYRWGRLVGHQLGLCGVLVGGSSIYLQSDGSNDHRGRDFDAVLVLQTKTDIVALLTDPEKREELHALLDIDRAETDILPLLLSDRKAQDHFDTVRFAGFTASGDKKSVKITSREHFEDRHTRTDHILSFKDRRVYKAAGPGNIERFRLQQVSNPFSAMNSSADHNTSQPKSATDLQFFTMTGYTVERRLSASMAHVSRLQHSA